MITDNIVCCKIVTLKKSTCTKVGVFKGDVYLYLHCFPLQGAVTIITIIWMDENGVTEEVVLNCHEVAQTR